MTFQTGMKVTWRYEERGGYGFIQYVPGIVVKQTSKRVVIAVRRKTGEMVYRSVLPEKLEVKS